MIFLKCIQSQSLNHFLTRSCPCQRISTRCTIASAGDAAVLQSASLVTGVFSQAADTHSACFHVIAARIFYKQCHEVCYDGHMTHSNSNRSSSQSCYNVNKCVSQSQWNMAAVERTWTKQSLSRGYQWSVEYGVFFFLVNGQHHGKGYCFTFRHLFSNCSIMENLN